MGGLVAANYLNLGSEQQKKVETYVSIGTPYLGSVVLAEVFEQCNALEDVSNFLKLCVGVVGVPAEILNQYAGTATDVVHNIPSIYELLPNRQYHTVAQKSYIKLLLDGQGIQEKHFM